LRPGTRRPPRYKLIVRDIARANALGGGNDAG
jgi:hypothetical protein